MMHRHTKTFAKIQHWLVALILFFGAHTIHAQTPHTIRFTTEHLYWPFFRALHRNRFDGFDVALTQLLCRNTDNKCRFIMLPWERLLVDAQFSQFTAAIATITASPSRMQQAYFTTPYYLVSARFVALKKSHLTEADLKGKLIGVETHSTYIDYLRSRYGDTVRLRQYQDQVKAFNDLKSGRIDAVFTNNALATDFVKDEKSGKFELLGSPIRSQRFFGGDYVIAVQKGHRALLDRLNRALHDIQTSGEYKRLYHKYLAVV